MNTLEFNKKCADFLQWKNLNDESFPEYLNLKSEFYPLQKLLFHSDWNWIMEIINKIQELNRFNIVIENCFCYVTDNKNILTLSCPNDSTKEAVIQTIDKFIDWYNLNK